MKDCNLKVCFILFGVPPEFSGASIYALKFSKFLNRMGIRTVFLSHIELYKYERKTTVDGSQIFRFFNKFSENNVLKYNIKLLYNLFKIKDYFTTIYINGNPGQFWTPFYVILFKYVFNKNVFMEINMEYRGDSLSIKNTKFETLKLYIAARLNKYVCLSSAIEESLKSISLSRSICIKASNGVDTSLFRPVENEQQKMELRKKLALPLHKRIIVKVGSIIKRKGIDFLMTIMSDVIKYQEDIYFIVAGPFFGEEFNKSSCDFASRMLRLAEEDQFESRVKFLGNVTNVQDFLRSSDLAVFAGRQEGSPNAIREAMACGLPVISLNLPNCTSDMIDHGHDGILVNIEDQNKLYDFQNHKIEDLKCRAEFVKWIRRMLNDENLARNIGSSARKKMVEKFSMEAKANFFLELFSGKI